ncbi:RNA exonuclease 3 [Chytriomyces hyalinus]|nr:RNA exonuclease 3 [Chytriomyces hyalinus]
MFTLSDQFLRKSIGARACPHNACPLAATGYCWFSHATPAAPALQPVPRKRQASATAEPAKRPRVNSVLSSNGSSPSITQAPATAINTASMIRAPVQLPRRSEPVANPIRVAQSSTGLARPIAPIALHSKVDRTRRQKILDHFFNEFARIYASIPEGKGVVLAQEHAVKQEGLLLAKASKPEMYTTLAMPVLNRLKKRPVATSDSDVGIDGEWIAPTDRAGGSANNPPNNLLSELPPLAAFEAVLVTIQDMIANKYPMPSNPSAASEESNKMPIVCDRCRAPFKPKLILEPEDYTSCSYHPMRVQLQPVLGAAKQRIYPCCVQDLTAKGCATGPHVFKESSFEALHARIPFTMLPTDSSAAVEPVLVAGVDCEMSYTAGGMECTRVSIVGLDGVVIVDELVKPQFPIVDFNTAWSGITDLSNAKYTLQQLHSHLVSKGITRNTILVGHSLESDLNALRLIHTRVIDSSILIPKRPPPGGGKPGIVYKHSLKTVCDKLLGRKIQMAGGSGHDSAEDARGALDVVVYCLKEMGKGRTVSMGP